MVVTDKGAVRGAIRNGVREFKGIPYAKPPVGELRWSIPATGGGMERHAAMPPGTSSACPQAERYGIPESSDNEDCLHLNVTVPNSQDVALAASAR